ncbi:hypothetical protein ORJ00_12795 [Rheinheimera baltica]|uniref:transporter substrate-binding domain-containing protein n=1 Tax=Rheinheimera baltica TaxID=67576 RepID=UPI00273EB885|nr:hypothetical protein [Rheinheimera baltica]MDP5143625.1 hypothetical protein [Rheinheimera baltica]MDP5151017.1 hypothetical protein [Rheinheimera baltica]
MSMRLCSAILNILLLSFVACAEHLTLYTEHFPPYSYVKSDTVTGLNTELVRLTCEKAQLQCDFVLYPWLRAYEAATKNPQGALYSTSRNPLREPLFKWVGPLAQYGKTVDVVEPMVDLSVVGANYLALNLALPDTLVQKLQTALDQLYASGEYQRLTEQYLKP